MNELHLFAGAGGGVLGGMLLGHTPICAVEIDPYCRKTMLQRQRDGILPWFPVWDDIRTFDGTPWRGAVDVVCGGFPCQDISVAGKGAGIEGERSGLWSEMARVIGEVRPRFAFVENSPALVSRGLGRVLGDLSEVGFDARWGVVGAGHAGAFHARERLWILASDAMRPGCEEQHLPAVTEAQAAWRVRDHDFVGACDRTGRARSAGEPRMVGVGDVVANRVDRLKAIGNGQVSSVAALAWRLLGGP